MKSPPVQYPDDIARNYTEAFIQGKIGAKISDQGGGQ